IEDNGLRSSRERASALVCRCGSSAFPRLLELSSTGRRWEGSHAEPQADRREEICPTLEGDPLGYEVKPSHDTANAEVDVSDPPPTFSAHTPQVYSGGQKKEPTGTVPSKLPRNFQSPAAEANILTHGAHLNENGESLYRFVLQKTLTPPKVTVKTRGSHEEFGVPRAPRRPPPTVCQWLF
ncbi:hypothetical protein CF336_g8952, partial [Tilletia laevis]